jgi:hypothetical protein
LTSRQFYKEAVPFFYSINRFYFPYLEYMKSALNSLAPSRLQYLAHISLEYEWTSVVNQRDAKQTCALLLRLEGLRKLDICIDEDRYELRASRKDYSLRGLQSFEKLRGLDEINFHGTCPTIEARLRPLVTQRRLAGEETRSRKSNKREAEENVEEPSRKRKTKRSLK